MTSVIRTVRIIFYTISTVFCVSCSTQSKLDIGVSSAVFEAPESYLDEDVEFCGWMTEHNTIIPSSVMNEKSGEVGFEVLSFGDLKPRYIGPICVTGPIRYIGCRTGENICVDWVHDYAVEISQFYIPDE